MMNYWSNHARNGSPNDADLPEWKPWSNEQGEVL
ncbi:MAG: carboxylesterase family protein [Proteobacteria bacterium]|nr:carboxylesterase family protein [Pseudomonadota bacterium]